MTARAEHQASGAVLVIVEMTADELHHLGHYSHTETPKAKHELIEAIWEVANVED